MRENPWLPVMTFLIFAGPAILTALALVLSDYDPACYGQLRPKAGCVSERTAAATSLADLASLPLFIFSIGWVGSERIWFLRAYRRQRISVGQAFRMLWRFWGRFFRLGLLFTLGFVGILVVGVTTHNIPLFVVLVIVFGLVVDFTLTFVTPALAYSTNGVFEGMSSGWRMIGDHWPRSVPYVFIPPLVLLLLGHFLPPSFIGLAATTALACVGALANLWFKGAVAAFYLRATPDIPDDGSAHMRTTGTYPDVPPPERTWP